MLLPAIGFVSGVLVFGVVAFAVLSFAKKPGTVRPASVAIFIAAAFVGAIVWAEGFRLVFADSSGKLNNPVFIILFLLGLPVAGTVAGWAATRRMARRA